VQQARFINLLMFMYSTDHDGKYPEGNSSTEIFQKLLDEKYASDPAIFYLPYAGKTKGIAGKKLKPENVCWDVTCCLDSNSSDFLPVVFMTGYKVTYVPGGSAVPLVKPFPRFGWEEHPNQTFFGWLMGRPTGHYAGTGGLAVLYKANNASFRKLETSSNSDGIVPHFISPDFKPDGKTYRQLTPDGPLP
jgi:hypothetical protein